MTRSGGDNKLKNGGNKLKSGDNNPKKRKTTVPSSSSSSDSDDALYDCIDDLSNREKKLFKFFESHM